MCDGEFSYVDTTRVICENSKWYLISRAQDIGNRTAAMAVADGAVEYYDPSLKLLWYAWKELCCCEEGAHLRAKTWYKYGCGQMPDWDAEMVYTKHWMKCRPKKEGNGKHSGKWAFTLTCSPKDGLNKQDMIKAVRKVLSQRSCPVQRYAWYYEHLGVVDGVETHPHIHGMYELESGGRIEAKHWKRAWPIWDEKVKLGQGFRGGYHRPVRSDEGYADYIQKQGLEGENNIEGNSIDEKEWPSSSSCTSTSSPT